MTTNNKNYDFDFSQIKIKYQPPAPPYPEEAKAAKITGTIVIELTIGTDGVPISAHAIEGPNELREVTEKYCLAWRFEPATLDGIPHIARFKMFCPWRLKKH